MEMLRRIRLQVEMPVTLSGVLNRFIRRKKWKSNYQIILLMEGYSDL